MSEHPHNREWFISKRKEIHTFVSKIDESIENGKRIILAEAEVKAGKKEIVECIKTENPDIKGYYITSLNRKDVKNQKDELALYGIETFVVNNDSVISKIITDVTEHIKKGKKVYFFFDECDYGSGKNQKIAGVFTVFMNTPEVIHILISATAQETLFASIADRSDFETLKFIPPTTYKGAKYFLENDLVYTPKPFILKQPSSELTITPHAYDVMRESFTETRNIGGIRITGKGYTTETILTCVRQLEKMVNRHFDGGYHGRPFKIKVIDSNNEFNWEDSITRRGYTCQPLEANWLFIFNQTCTRGTDLKDWHPNLAFWHDARPCNSCNLNTLLQAILRPSHYSACYTKNMVVNGKPQIINIHQPIRLYVDKAAVKAATGDFTDYKKAKGKAPTRTIKTRNNAEYETHEDDNYESLKKYFSEINQPFPPLSTFPKNGEFYKSSKSLGINEEDRNREIWDYDNAKRLKFQENRRHHYYIIPAYRNLTEFRSLVWIITRKLSKQDAEKLKTFKATSKSMYEI